MKRPVVTMALVFALLASTGCSLGSVGGRSGRTATKATSTEIAALEARISKLQRQAAIAEVELARLQRRLDELESSVASRPSAPSGSSVETAAKPVAPDGRPAAPREVESVVEVSDLPAEPDPPAPPAADAGETGETGADSTLTESAQALYDRGYTLFHRGHYVDSETAFQQFLSRYGATVLGDNAQFWIAEARYARGDIAGARSAYLETATRFPNGNKAPDALLKAGDCALELGDREAARQSFRDLLEEFPGSAAAGAARERIGLLP